MKSFTRQGIGTGREEGKENGEDRLTRLKGVCKLLSNAHEDDFSEEILGLSLWDAECPRTTADVAPVFPDGFDTAFEEMDRVFEFESVEGEVVHDLPE